METSSADIRPGRARRLAVLVTGLLGVLYFGLIVQLFFTGIDEWEMLGVTVKLRPWYKPLWIGVCFWLLMLAAAKAPPRPFAFAGKWLTRAVEGSVISLSPPGRGWAVGGAFIGSVLAFFFSAHFYYLAPSAAF